MSAFVTPGSESLLLLFELESIDGDGSCTDTKFIMLHEAKNDDGIRAFFMDVWELYVKVSPVHSQVSRGCDADDSAAVERRRS